MMYLNDMKKYRLLPTVSLMYLVLSTITIFGMTNLMIYSAYCQVSIGVSVVVLLWHHFIRQLTMLHILICYWLMHHPMFIVLLNEVC